MIGKIINIFYNPIILLIKIKNYNNLYPSPPITKLLYYKKKFYRNNIDPDFDINYIPPEGEEMETEYKPPLDVIEKNLKNNKKKIIIIILMKRNKNQIIKRF